MDLIIIRYLVINNKEPNKRELIMGLTYTEPLNLIYLQIPFKILDFNNKELMVIDVIEEEIILLHYDRL